MKEIVNDVIVTLIQKYPNLINQCTEDIFRVVLAPYYIQFRLDPHLASEDILESIYEELNRLDKKV